MGATIVPAPKAYSVLLTIFVHLHHLAHHLISKTAPITHACIYFSDSSATLPWVFCRLHGWGLGYWPLLPIAADSIGID